MAFVVSATFILLEEEHKNENIRRKRLRDNSDPFDLPEDIFIQCFRLNKEGFMMVLNKIVNNWKTSSIPLTLELAATLRFLAEGSFQRSVGNDVNISMHRTPISKSISKNAALSGKKNMCRANKVGINGRRFEKIKKKFFYEKYGIPGVVGCIDGTHVAIKRPTDEEYLYFNRKGYYSINVMIICDYKMDIKAVDATRPGSSHDSFIWNMSNARNVFMSKYDNSERGSWLLADSGYALEPFVMTPYKSPSSITQQNFNKKHASGRNIVEITIGVLKSRFRCLSPTLWYSPLKAVQITNICCALHNLCNFLNVQNTFEIVIEEADDDSVETNEENEIQAETIHQNDANSIRNDIAESLNSIFFNI